MASRAQSSIRWVLAVVILTCCVGCDQATKRMATQGLRGRAPQSYFSDSIRLQYALNPGAFLSLGSNLAPRARFWVFTVLNAEFVVVVVCLFAARRDLHAAESAAFVLVLAGGLGNLIDRLFQNGLVTDFINLGIGPVRTGIFNVADAVLVLGASALLVMYLRQGAGQDRRSR